MSGPVAINVKYVSHDGMSDWVQEQLMIRKLSYHSAPCTDEELGSGKGLTVYIETAASESDEFHPDASPDERENFTRALDGLVPQA